MIIRKIDSLRGTDRDVKFNAGRSIRMILESDKMGFSFHQTEMPASKESFHWHYKNHLESCYCIEGFGLLTNLTTMEVHEVRPGDIYILNENDDHLFRPLEDTVLISVFNPPIKSNETHRGDGSYE